MGGIGSGLEQGLVSTLIMTCNSVSESGVATQALNRSLNAVVDCMKASKLSESLGAEALWVGGSRV